MLGINWGRTGMRAAYIAAGIFLSQQDKYKELREKLGVTPSLYEFGMDDVVDALFYSSVVEVLQNGGIDNFNVNRVLLRAGFIAGGIWLTQTDGYVDLRSKIAEDDESGFGLDDVVDAGALSLAVELGTKFAA